MEYSKYEKYKDSGIAWLGEIPEHWEVRRLKYNADILNGFAFKSEEYKDNGIPIIRIGDLVSESEVNINGKFVDDKYLEIAKNFKVKKGDILLAMTGATIGKTSYYSLNTITLLNQRVGLIRCSNLFNQKFLSYLLRTPNFKEYVDLECGGSAQDNIGKTELNNFITQTPPKQEQTTIANFLDYKTEKINRFITKKKQLIELLNEQKVAIINQAVTKGINPNVPMKDSGIEWLGKIPEHWETTKLIGASNFVRGNSSFKKDELLSNGNYVALQYGKTYKIDEVDENFQFYVNDEFYKDSQIVNKGDVIIVSTSETIEDLGHSAFYNRTDIGLLGGEQMLLKPNKKIDGKYLYYSSKVFTKELRKYSTGVKVFRFNINDLKTIYTSIPPIEEQIKISEYIQSELNTVTKTITTIEKEITLVEEYKTALIAEAVTGKIDVRKWSESGYSGFKEEQDLVSVTKNQVNPKIK